MRIGLQTKVWVSFSMLLETDLLVELQSFVFAVLPHHVSALRCLFHAAAGAFLPAVYPQHSQTQRTSLRGLDHGCRRLVMFSLESHSPPSHSRLLAVPLRPAGELSTQFSTSRGLSPTIVKPKRPSGPGAMSICSGKVAKGEWHWFALQKKRKIRRDLKSLLQNIGTLCTVMAKNIGTLGKYDQRSLWKLICIVNPFDLLFYKFTNI